MSAPGTTRTGRRRLWVAGGLVAAALGLLLVQGLGEATLYFRTADEAVAQREALGTRRFRIEGDVVGDSVAALPGGVAFLITSKGVEVPVRHKGDPPELFGKGIPVVLEGRFEGATFASDRILVKHSETYVAENPERVRASPASPSPASPSPASPSPASPYSGTAELPAEPAP